MLLLYDNALSSNALKARFLLAELGLAYERREVPLERPRPDWFLRVNPVGGIPVLDDDGFLLPESNAILRYLAAGLGRDDLYPAAPRERARVDRVLDLWSTYVRPGVFPVERAGGILGELDEAALAEALPGAVAVWDTVEQVIDGNGTATGGFTLADVCAAPTLYRWRKLPFEHARWPRLTALADAVLARESFLAAGPVR